jgi:hypothetical protein
MGVGEPLGGGFSSIALVGEMDRVMLRCPHVQIQRLEDEAHQRGPIAEEEAGTSGDG